jgi:hypothetical protein
MIIHPNQSKFFNFSEEDLNDFSFEEKNYLNQISKDSKDINEWKQVIKKYNKI